jgi:CRISPR-associated protein Csh1
LVGDGTTHALALAVHSIRERQTCFLSVLDAEGRLPGEVDEYIVYLQHILAAEKYSTGRLQPTEDGRCALSGLRGTVYPNALAGAGLNLTNVDRSGVFPGLDDGGAWKKFALSAEAADLLYTFSYHVSGRFRARVAGENALLIPYTTLDFNERRKFMRRVRDKYLPQVDTGKPLVQQEDKLRSLVDEEGVITNLTILWADFGQKLENVRGTVTDILPSRLRTISEVAGGLNNDVSLPFPEERNYGESLELDVTFNYLAQLLRRPGGKRTEKVNKGARLFEFKREMAAAVYHGQQVPVKRFWEEAGEVQEAYLIDALEHNHYGLLYEGRTKQGENYLTMAGWIRHLCRFIYFLRQLEVYPGMEDWRYQPRAQRLRSVFSEFFEDADGRTGIDRPEKAYAFMLGALFGKLMQVQGARGVNVGANALPWLKRFTLTGKDLPELYVKIREKLLTYGTRSGDIANVIEELGYLGTTLGTRIDLNQTETGYFLLLGQSLSSTFMPSKATPNNENANGEGTT